MSKVLLHFRTELGPRTIIAEIGDASTARAIVNAHLANGEGAALVEEMPRTSLKDHMTKHKKALAKAAKLTVVPRADNVHPLRKAKVRS
jgi:hypothetical protein